jgi:hypothetical protein
LLNREIEQACFLSALRRQTVSRHTQLPFICRVRTVIRTSRGVALR